MWLACVGEFTGDPWISRTDASNAEIFPFDEVIMVPPLYASIFLFHGLYFNINCFSRYEDFQYKQTTVFRPSYLYNGNPHTGKTALMTHTAQVLLHGRCPRTIGPVVKQAVEVLWLGPINCTAGWSYPTLILAIIHYKHNWSFSFFFFSEIMIRKSSIVS